MKGEFKLLVRMLRAFLDVSQQEMASVAGIDRTVLSRYETGDMIPSPATLKKLVMAAGLSMPYVEALLLPVIRRGLAEAAGARSARGLSPMGMEGLEAALASTARTGVATFLSAHSAAVPKSDDALEERQDAADRAELWMRLEASAPGARRLLVEEAPPKFLWDLSQRLCEKSAITAAEDTGKALELARLALKAAELASGEQDRSASRQAIAWAFIGNARRVGGDFTASEAAFAMAGTLWRAGTGAGAEEWEWRLADLEASLRRDQRQWQAALDLLDRAYALAPQTCIARVLIKKATTFEQAGKIDTALTTLTAAEAALAEGREPRLRWLVEYNKIACLVQLERFEEAERRLPDALAQAAHASHDLDLVRLHWLRGRVAAGLGRRQEAEAAFEQVHARFTASANRVETALVSLDLAILYIEEGRYAAVYDLAAALIHAFEAQGIHREALASLRLFREAAERQAATVEQVRQILSDLEGRALPSWSARRW